MVIQIMSIYDRAVQAFMQPFAAFAVGGAIQSFTDEVNRPAEDNKMFKHAEDFEMFHVGTFDDNTGKFEAFESPRLVVRALDVKK